PLLLAMLFALLAWEASVFRTEEVGEPPAAARPSIPGPEAIPREGWNASPARSAARPMGVPRRITVHHSGRRSSGLAGADVAREIRGIQRDHQVRAGWADIAYHFVIDRTGRLWEGRPLSLQGAHAGNDAANRGNIGVCLLGDFDVEGPTAEQRQALRDLVLRLESLYGIPPGEVFAHHRIRAAQGLGSTNCPGRHLLATVDGLRRDDPETPPVPEGGPALGP
ncbi:MAG: peptidoglycan recognition protein family protein, partial [Planctomycetota bacterium]